MFEHRPERFALHGFMATMCLILLTACSANAKATHAGAAPAPKQPGLSPAAVGKWTNVTPPGVVLNDALSCGNYGTQSVQADPGRPSDLYTLFMCQGIWKSTDFGATWAGPINKGSNGKVVGDCAGGIAIPSNRTATAHTLYVSCIRGEGNGFWRSVDGGVSWTRYSVAPTPDHQDYYAPAIDPYDEDHLLMAAHERDVLVESINGGKTWKQVTLAGGMNEKGGTAAIFFINRGNPAATRATWLWIAQASGGNYGTWRTSDSGATWQRVDKNEHSHGASQLFQPDSSGVVFIAGAYSDHGFGVLRSTDYGQIWSHVGNGGKETVVVGTSKNVFAMSGGPLGIGGVEDPVFEMAPQPGTGTWVMPGTPAALTQGPGQIAVVNDGTHNILVGAMWNAGLWRYIEP